MGLDQIVLEKDGLQLVVGGHEIDRFDFFDQRRAKRIAHSLPDEVGTDSVPQIPGLPDVDHISLGVLVEVDAGAIGQVFESSFQSLEAIVHGTVTTTYVWLVIPRYARDDTLAKKSPAAARNSSVHW